MSNLSVPTLRQVWGAFVYAILLSMGEIVGALLYQHREDPDIQAVAIRVVLDSLPFLASMVFALWPQVSRAHIGFRLTILLGGLLWSGLLAKKDYLDLQQSRKDQQTAISTAVKDANEHSDQQIAGVRTDIDNRFTSLEQTIGKGFNGIKPPPLQFAALGFRFFDSPGNALSMHGDADRVFTMDFTSTDTTDKAAEKGDIWVEICGSCVFAKEPKGFDKPIGIAETARHKTFGILNAGVSLEKMTIDVKPPKGVPSFEIAWSYSCETCGKKGDSQKFTINILPPYKVTVPPPKLN